MKEYTIYAGVNGAGKSTLYEVNKDVFLKRVNADELLVLAGKDWRDTSSIIFAMRESVRLVKDYLSKGESFCQETTLTGKTILKSIITAKENGYTVKMFYVGLENVDMSIERVAARVQKGGHGIPEDVLRRRFGASVENLKRVVELCDKVTIYDNSENFKLIATFKNGKIIERSDAGVKWFQELFPIEKKTK
jgi:predicted ABC-type ATPase